MTAGSPRYRLGIDVGGTFTDIVVAEATTGDVRTLKVPTQHGRLAEGVTQGILLLLQREGIAPETVVALVHGTTLATNTVIERTGAPVGLLVTRGTRDILELGRLRLGDPTNFYSNKPVPLVPRGRVREVQGRLQANGAELEPLDEDDVVRAAGGVLRAGAEALAICFLHSYVNSDHETRAANAVRTAFPDTFVTTSCDVWPQQREYERAVVTVMNALLGTRINSYLKQLSAGVADLGLSPRFLCTKSNGGVMSADEAAVHPVHLLLSGPAAGVVGAFHLAGLEDETQLVTLDIGGTSADVAVVAGRIPYSTESRVGEYPVVLPTVDVSAIGAGGGSIAWIDAVGLLKVGPKSAGSDPGPAGYGQGGVDATVTDAYVTAGIVAPDRFLGGTMPLDKRASEEALRRLGDKIGLTAVEAAAAIIDITTASMQARILPFLAARGVAAAESTLYAYGGAGPTHAFLLARELNIEKVLVPPTPGALCALGCLVADLRMDFIQSVALPCTEDAVGVIARVFQDLGRRGQGWLSDQATAVSEAVVIRSADMRYSGQSFDVNVVIPTILDAGVLKGAFEDAYEKVYLHRNPHSAVEIVNLRVQVVGVLPKPRNIRPSLPRGVRPSTASRRRVYLDGSWIDVQVHDRYRLLVGDSFLGPAVIEQYDTTVFVPPGFEVTVDPQWHISGRLSST